MRDTILVTGGSGFIGSALCRFLIRETRSRVVNLDALTYAAHPMALDAVRDHPRYRFEKADVSDRGAVEAIFRRHQPTTVIHLAAESHVDRSIDDPDAFVRTNLVGTHTMLEAARRHWSALSPAEAGRFRFLHVSTDEVFGTLDDDGAFDEDSRYRPNSPYSATKAGADHLVRAWHRTYGLPTLVSNCSNNYGPYQYPEKLIPLTITRAIRGETLPVYGSGANVRDWLHVEDHVRALWLILTEARPGSDYTIGGRAERRNIDVVRSICAILDEMPATAGRGPHSRLISFVTDRPGHDHRYAVDASRIARDLGWAPVETFESGLEATVRWYLANPEFWGARTLLPVLEETVLPSMAQPVAAE
jgi:dTDP-glucose 4,6-dehydratase